MKIELKAIKHSPSLSQETEAFTADVYVNGVKTGYAHDEGCGGSIDYDPYDGKGELLAQAEAYAKSLPSTSHRFGGEIIVLESNLESVIGDLLSEWLKAKDTKKFNDKVAKSMLNNIVFGVPNSGSVSSIGYGKTPLKAICLSQQGRDQVKGLIARITKDLKEGEEILNTNLKELGVI